jgi:type III pantothenate kinase
MNLVVDFGNTSVKVGIVENQCLKEVVRFDTHHINMSKLRSLIRSVSPEIICYLTVTHIDHEIIDVFNNFCEKIIQFDHSFPLPFHIEYFPKSSLGIDRLAGVIGARALYPASDVLVIQSGTCITYDLYVEKSGYIGGAIAPGIGIRNKAMHTFTYQLPMVTLENIEHCDVIAHTTEDSLRSGILNGALFEIEGYIRHAEQFSNELKVIFSGGDMIYFVKKIKSQIFAHSNLTLTGLSEIIQMNEHNNK